MYSKTNPYGCICQPQGFTILLMVYNLGASGFMVEECLQYDSP